MNSSDQQPNEATTQEQPQRCAVERAVHRETHRYLVPNPGPSTEQGPDRSRDGHRDVHASISSKGVLREVSSLVNDCGALYRELRFDEGIARARRDSNWEHDPKARLHVAIGLHYKHQYDDARAEYAVAVELSTNASFQGTCLANVGTTWYEEGDLGRALDCFERSLVIDPLNEFGLMSAVMIAAERRDADEVVRLSARVCERWPDWRTRTVILHCLTVDRSYRFLRKSPGLMERAFGVTLDALFAG